MKRNFNKITVISMLLLFFSASAHAFDFPESISDLTALTTGSGPDGRVRLTWTVPDTRDGQHRPSGTSINPAYQVKYSSTNPIPHSSYGNDYTWVNIYDDAKYWTNFKSSGTAETRVISSLSPGVTYYFAVRVKHSNNLYGVWNSSTDAIPINTANVTYPYINITAPTFRYDKFIVFKTSVTWFWNHATNAAGYRVKCATASTSISGDLPSSTTIWTQRNLTPNSTASIYVEAFNGLYKRDSAIVVSSFTFPNPPTNIIVMVDGNTRVYPNSSLAIQWDTNGNSPQTRYSVEYSTYATYKKIMNLTRSTTHNQNTGLSENKVFYFRVWATNNNNVPIEAVAEKGSYSITTIGVAPSPPPLDICVTGTNDGEVTLRWSSSGNDGTLGVCSDYIVKWATYTITQQNFNTVTSSVTRPRGKSITAANEIELEFIKTGLYPGATYSFALEAEDDRGNRSLISVVKSTTTMDKPPNAPENVNAVVKSSYSVNVQWGLPDVSGTDDRDKYKIYHATFPFSSLVANVSINTTNHSLIPLSTFYMVRGLLAETSYYFRVSCVDQSTDTAKGHFSGRAFESILSATTGFARTPDTTPPARITQITASTGTTEGKINLKWTNTGDDVSTHTITHGKIRIDWTKTYPPVFNFNTPQINVSTTTAANKVNTYTASSLDPGSTYYFRIWLADEAGNWSSISKGATAYAQWDITPPGASTQFNAQAGWRRATVSWVSPADDGDTGSISGGISRFEIRYSIHANMSAPVTVVTKSTTSLSSSSIVKGTLCSYIQTGLNDTTTYYFKIRAYDERNKSSGDSVATATACPMNNSPSSFSLFKPDNNVVSGVNEPNFQWNAVADPDLAYGDIITYTLYYSTTAGVMGKGTQNNAGSSTVFTPTTALIENTTYYWNVQATDLDGASVFSSEPWSVRINAVNSAPSSFVLVAPANTSIVYTSTPTLSWDKSTDPDPGDTVSYWVEYSRHINFISFSSSTLQSSRSFVTPKLDENETYFWRVWATDTLKSTLCSTTFYFRVNAVPEKPAVFNLGSPVENARFTANQVTFTWESTTQPDPAADERVKYNLSYSLFSNFVPSTTLTGLMSNTTSVVVPFDNRNYYWQVDAVGPYGQVRTSNQRLMFYTDAVKELSVWNGYELISPTGSIKIINTLTPLFKWNTASDPDPSDTIRYFLQYSVNPTFDGAPTIPVGTDTYYQPLSDSPLLDQSTYYWRVRASGFDQSIPPKQVDPAYTFSSVGVFIISMTNNPPKSFDLSSPAKDTIIKTKTPSFTWAQSIDTDLNDYVRYSFYISSVSKFSPIYYTTSSLVQTNFTIPVSNRLLENRVYYWKVVSNDRKGLQTICTSTFVFSVPVLNIPVAPDGLRGVLADNQQSFTLSWSTAVKNSDGADIDDLSGYKVYRALSLTTFNYDNPLAYIPAGPNQWTDTTISGGAFYYLIRTMDTSGIESDNSMILASLNPGELNIVSGDNEVFIVVPKDITTSLLSENNKYHKNLSLNIDRKLSTEGDNILRSYDIKILDNQLNEMTDYKFDTPITLSFDYSTINSAIARKAPSLTLNPKNLAAYWNNGVEFIKLGGYTDESKKKFVTLALRSGSFQLRQTSLAVSFGATLTPKKVFTPGVLPWDKMTFIVNNPTGDKVIGKIYDLKGEFVADLKATNDPTNTTVTLEWDGKGTRKGVYLYQIESEGKAIHGTVMVAR